MYQLVINVLLICLCSCSTFVAKPDKLRTWQYSDIKSCPKVFKVYSEQVIDHFLNDKHVFTCTVIFADSQKIECIKRSSFFPDISEKQAVIETEALVKRAKDDTPCLVSSRLDEANFVMKSNTQVIESLSVPWLFATGFSLTLIPYRGKTTATKTIEIVNVRNGKIKMLNEEWESILWIHLFLLPVTPFIDQYSASEKILSHQNELIFSSMVELTN